MRALGLLLIVLLAGCTGAADSPAADPVQGTPDADLPAGGNATTPTAPERPPVVNLASGLLNVSIWLPATDHNGAQWIMSDSVDEFFRSPFTMAGWLLEVRTTSPHAGGEFALHLMDNRERTLEFVALAHAPLGEYGRAWVSQTEYAELADAKWYVSAYTDGSVPTAALQVSWEVAFSHLPAQPDDSWTGFEA